MQYYEIPAFSRSKEENMTVKNKATAEPSVPGKTGAGRKFPVKKLRANCRQLFGVSSSTFDGATYGMTGEYTVDEISAQIKEWGSKRGVK